MRILLAKCFRPFETAPSDRLAMELMARIREAGHLCELVRVPETDPENLKQLMMTLEIENTDRLVCLDSPSHEIRHPCRILVQLFPLAPAKSHDAFKSDDAVVARVLLSPETGGDQAGVLESMSRVAGRDKTRSFANVGELAAHIIG